jgi:anti-anti-sigma regulatory factor
MAGYHSFELAYLAAVYTNLLIRQEPMDFYFRPVAGNLPSNILRVAPDLLPAGSMRIAQVWINGVEHRDFDAQALTVQLPASGGALKVRVRLVPSGIRFTADLLEVTGGTATITLCGVLDDSSVSLLTEQLDAAVNQQARSIVFQADDLSSISAGALRALVFRKQKLGAPKRTWLLASAKYHAFHHSHPDDAVFTYSESWAGFDRILEWAHPWLVKLTKDGRAHVRTDHRDPTDDHHDDTSAGGADDAAEAR